MKLLRIFAVLILLAPGLANALVLLGEITDSEIGNGLAPGTAPVNDGLYFLLGYGFNSFTGGSKPLGLDWDYFIGSEKKWSLGETGTFDFNAGNSPDFGEVTARLADGVEDNLSRGILAVNTDGSLFPGSVGTGPDSFFFPNPLDSIDFIRLIVDETSLTFTQSETFFSHESSISGKWQIWGTASVPEPTIIALIGLGLVGLGFARRRIKV